MSQAATPGRTKRGRPAADRSGSPVPTIPGGTLPIGASGTQHHGPVTCIPVTTSTPVRPIALDPDTGQIKAYHQYHWNNSWDWDEVRPPMLINMQHNGQTIDALVHPGRDGYLWTLQQTDNGIKFISGAAVRLPECVQEHRPTDRPADLRSRAYADLRQGDQVLSLAVGRPGLAIRVLQRSDAPALHPRQRQHVRADAGRKEAAHRRPALARR